MPFVRLVNPSRKGGEKTMARHKKGHRSRKFLFGRRRNPILGMSGGDLLSEGIGVVAGAAGSRIIPQMVLGSNNTGIVGYGANAASGIGISWLLRSFSPRLAHGAMLGTVASIAMRVVSDLWGQNALTGGLSGDLGGDLGFYVNNSFPLPTAGVGPMMLNPGYSGGPQLSFAVPGMPAPAVVSTPAGTQAASNGSAGGANAALATATSGPSAPAGVWQNPWAA